MHYPDLAHAKALLGRCRDRCGGCTLNRPFGEPVEALLPKIRQELGVAVLADCQTLEDAKNAQRIGVDAVAPTFGFGTNSIGTEPDFALLKAMIKLGLRVIAEGGFWEPQQVVKAFELGCWSVVVGSASPGLWT